MTNLTLKYIFLQILSNYSNLIILDYQGTKKVEVMMLNMYNEREEHLDAKVFSKMKKMRFLKIGNVQLRQGLNYLSKELRVLEWHRYPLKSMPTSFQPNKLIELRMHCSNIKQLWKEIMVRFSHMRLCIFFLSI